MVPQTLPQQAPSVEVSATGFSICFSEYHCVGV
jgi:hypothetical protein